LSALGIVAALHVESRALRPKPAGRPAVAMLSDGTLLAVSGPGPVAAARGARGLVAAGARALVSWGMAGGLDPQLAPGSVVLPSEVIACDGTRFRTSGSWRERLAAAIAGQRPVSRGALRSCARTVSSRAEKAALFRDTAAAAVDMESAAVAEVAARAGLPFLAVKVIVDDAATSLPPALAAVVAASGAVRSGRLLRSLVHRPADLCAVLQLMRRYRVATRALATVARCEALARHP
jgi:adenosylhomocysteine nucleosidase